MITHAFHQKKMNKVNTSYMCKYKKYWMQTIQYFKEHLIHLSTVYLWCCETDTSVVITIKNTKPYESFWILSFNVDSFFSSNIEKMYMWEIWYLGVQKHTNLRKYIFSHFLFCVISNSIVSLRIYIVLLLFTKFHCHLDVFCVSFQYPFVSV